MEKVKISISGHDFYLKSEDPNRMYETAENLQKRIDKLSAMAASMSLTDIVMLAALDIADENYDNRNVVIKLSSFRRRYRQNLLPVKKEQRSLKSSFPIPTPSLHRLELLRLRHKVSLPHLKNSLRELRLRNRICLR